MVETLTPEQPDTEQEGPANEGTQTVEAPAVEESAEQAPATAEQASSEGPQVDNADTI
jgi:hypothetical protein